MLDAFVSLRGTRILIQDPTLDNETRIRELDDRETVVPGPFPPQLVGDDVYFTTPSDREIVVTRGESASRSFMVLRFVVMVSH